MTTLEFLVRSNIESADSRLEKQRRGEDGVTAIMASLLSRAALATEKLALRSPKKVLIKCFPHFEQNFNILLIRNFEIFNQFVMNFHFMLEVSIIHYLGLQGSESRLCLGLSEERSLCSRTCLYVSPQGSWSSRPKLWCCQDSRW